MMNETFNLIEEITRLDGSIYFELGNIMHNGRAESERQICQPQACTGKHASLVGKF
ncbi:hypothetical protein GQS40_02385|uniref:Uncharacterized protein n=1 Tax=Leuconostoc lactis TaxID=1246 RepID=A0A6L7A542_LEULA|nr:hypothetical protein [Leuconostoc lactis]